MKERNITVTLEKAKEWYNSGDATLKGIALQAFNEKELISNFKDITTFKDACNVLSIDCKAANYLIRCMGEISKASVAMFKLNIIRKALNLGLDLHLTKDPYIYFPCNPFVTEKSIYYRKELNLGEMEVIGKIKSEGTLYNVLGGCADIASSAGLGDFCPGSGAGDATIDLGFLGCANEEIAEHLGKHFGMLITEAKYGDIENFEIVKTEI